MQRINTSTKAADLFGAGKHGFKDGNQSLGIVPTDLDATWFNQVQEEIANVVEAAAVALDANDRTQLLQAIKKITVEAGSKTVWFQAAAPTGWTQITTHNNKALRIVSGVGGGSGGTQTFTSVFGVRPIYGTVGNTTLTTAQIPAHTHPIKVNDVDGLGTFVADSNGTGAWRTANTDNSTGGGGSHTHTFTGSDIDFSVQYIDMIIASKD